MHFSFLSGARSESGEVKPRRQQGATVAIGGDYGRVMAQEWNQDMIN